MANRLLTDASTNWFSGYDGLGNWKTAYHGNAFVAPATHQNPNTWSINTDTPYGFRSNGIQYNTSATPSATPLPAKLGINNYKYDYNPINAQIGEIIIYNKVLSLVEIKAVENFLFNKYGMSGLTSSYNPYSGAYCAYLASNFDAVAGVWRDASPISSAGHYDLSGTDICGNFTVATCYGLSDGSGSTVDVSAVVFDPTVMNTASYQPAIWFSRMNTSGTTIYNEGTQGGTGTLNNASIVNTADKKTFTKDLIFNGTYYVSLPNITYGTNGVSIAFWFKSPLSTTEYRQFIKLIVDANNYIQIVNDIVGTNYIYTNIVNNGSNYNVGYQLPATVNTNTWFHFCITFNSNNTCNIYKDGALFHTNTTTFVFPIGQITTQIILGNFYVGELDDFRMYNRVITPTEVSQIYYNSRPQQIQNLVKGDISYTIFHVGRCAPDNYGLLLGDASNNWYSGFANGTAKVATRGGVSLASGATNTGKWLISTDTPYKYRANGNDLTVYNNTATSYLLPKTRLGLNSAITSQPAIWFSRMITNGGTTIYNEGSLGGSGTLTSTAVLNTSSYKTYTTGLIFNSSTKVSAPVFKPNTNGYSIAFWFKMKPNGQQRVFGFGLNSQNCIQIILGYNTNTNDNNSLTIFSIINNDWNTYNKVLTNTTSIANESWNHIAITHVYGNPTSLLTMYLNGGAVVVYRSDMYYPSYTNIFTYIGNDGTSSYIGEVDDFRIYNRVITQAEISDIYNLRFNNFAGHFGELIVYDRVLPTTEILKVENYLAKKYGLVDYDVSFNPYSVAYRAYESKNYNVWGTKGKPIVAYSNISAVNAQFPDIWFSRMDNSGVWLYNEGKLGGYGTMSVVATKYNSPKTYSYDLSFGGAVSLTAPIFQPTTNGFSISFWFKTTRTDWMRPIGFGIDGNTEYIIIINDNNTGGQGYITALNQVNGVWNTTSNRVSGNGGSSVYSGNWNLLTITHSSSSTLNMYFNGNNIINNYSLIYPVYTNTFTNIGKDYTSYFGGEMDDVRFYNCIISATEIADIYNLKSSAFNLQNEGTNTNPTTLALTNNIFSTASIINTTSYKTYSADLSFSSAFTYVSLSPLTISAYGQSFSFWFKSDFTTASNTLYNLTAGTTYLKIAGNANTVASASLVASYAYAGGSASTITTGTAINGAWHHLCVSLNQTNNTMTMYLDASGLSPLTVSAYPYGLVSTAHYLSSTGADFFVGEIDDFRIYDYVLSATEVRNVYSTAPILSDSSPNAKDLSGTDISGIPTSGMTAVGDVSGSTVAFPTINLSGNVALKNMTTTALTNYTVFNVARMEPYGNKGRMLTGPYMGTGLAGRWWSGFDGVNYKTSYHRKIPVIHFSKMITNGTSITNEGSLGGTGTLLSTDMINSADSVLYGKDLYFNGSSNILTITNFNVSNTGLTFTFWVKLLGNATSNIFQFNLFIIYMNYSQIVFFTNNGANYQTYNMNISNNWAHFCWSLTYSSGNTSVWTLYMNGLSVSPSGNTNGNVYPSLGNKTIVYGKNTGSNTNFILGELDDIRIYDYVLTANEIADIYYMGARPTLQFNELVPNTTTGTASVLTNEGYTAIYPQATLEGLTPPLITTLSRKSYKSALLFNSGFLKVAPYMPKTSGFSFCAWINPFALTPDLQRIFSNNDALGLGTHYMLDISSSKIRYSTGTSIGALTAYASSSTITANAWTHVAITHSSANEVVIYTNLYDIPAIWFSRMDNSGTSIINEGSLGGTGELSNSAMVNTADKKTFKNDLIFNGSSRIVAPLFQPTINGFSISFWFKVGSGEKKAFTFGIDSSNKYEININHNFAGAGDNSITFFSIVAGAWSVIDVNRIVYLSPVNILNSWNLITVTHIPSSFNMYLNGTNVILNKTTVAYQSVTTAFTYIYIGYNGGGYLTGELDDIRLYKRVITQAEITDIYNLNFNTITTNTLTYPNSTSSFMVGSNQDSAFPFKGYMDDIRTYDRVLSATDITGIYNNYSYPNDRATLSTGTQNDGKWIISTDTSANYRVNGANDTTGGAQTMTTLPANIGVNVAEDVSMNGQLAEVIVYDYALRPTEITAVENYLAQKYGIYNPYEGAYCAYLAENYYKNGKIWIDASPNRRDLSGTDITDVSLSVFTPPDTTVNPTQLVFGTSDSVKFTNTALAPYTVIHVARMDGGANKCILTNADYSFMSGFYGGYEKTSSHTTVKLDASSPAIWFSAMKTSGTTLYNEGTMGGSGTLLNTNIVNSSSFKTYTRDLSFNGTRINNIPFIVPNINGYSYSLWIKNTGSTSTNYIMHASTTGGVTTAMTIIYHVNWLKVLVTNTTNQWADICDYIPYNNIWTHMAFTHVSDGSYKGYINGNLVKTSSVYYPNYTTVSNCVLGSDFNGTNTTSGELDDFRVYNRVITQAEISDIYNLKYQSSFISGTDLSGIVTENKWLISTDFTQGYRANGVDLTTTFPLISSATDILPSVGLNMGTGGTNNSSGRFGEIIVYNRVLSPMEITSAENYLKTKYGMYGSVPYLHYTFDGSRNYVPDTVTPIPEIWFSQMNNSGTTLTNEGSLGGSGTLTNSAMVNTADKKTYTKDLSFNSSRNVSAPAFNPTINGYSISFWFKSTTTSQKTIIDFGYSSTYKTTIAFGYVSGTADTSRIRLNVTNNGGQTIFYYTNPTTLTFCDNTWRLFTLTHRGTNAIMYINGVNVATSSTHPYPDVSNPYTYTYIGGSAGDYYTGELDDIRMYNRVLTQDEITNIVSSTYNLANMATGTPVYDADFVGTLTTTDKKVGISSISFSSGTHFVNINKDIVPTVNGITVAFWIKPNDSTGSRRIFTFGDDRLYAFINTVTQCLSLFTGSTTKTDVIVNLRNRWTHIVWTLTYSTTTGSVWSVYKNGSLVTTFTGCTYPTLTAMSSGANYIAGYTGANNYTGGVDDFRFYHTVLSAKEIYNTFYSQASIYDTAYCAFEAKNYNTGGTWVDSSPNARNLSSLTTSLALVDTTADASGSSVSFKALALTNAQSITAFNPTYTIPYYTIFHIARLSALPSSSNSNFLGTSAQDTWSFGFYNQYQKSSRVNGTIKSTGELIDTVGTKWLLSTNAYDTYRANGVDISNASASSVALPILGLNLATNKSAGQFAEIIIYDRQLSLTEIVQVERFLANKYGLVLDTTTNTKWDLQLYYPFNQNTVSSAGDSIANMATGSAVYDASLVSLIQKPYVTSTIPTIWFSKMDTSGTVLFNEGNGGLDASLNVAMVNTLDQKTFLRDLSFNGTSSFVSPPLWTPQLVNGFTICFWVKNTNTSTANNNYGRIYESGQAPIDGSQNQMDVLFWNYNTTLAYRVINNNTTTGSTCSLTVPNNMWFHVAITHREDTSYNNVSMYLNGGASSITTSFLNYPTYSTPIPEIWFSRMNTDGSTTLYNEGSTGSVNNGTLTGTSPTSMINTVSYKTYSKDLLFTVGNTNFVNLSSITNTTNGLSFSCWIKPNSTGNMSRIFDFRNGQGNNDIFMYINNNNISTAVYYNGGSQFQPTLSGNSITNGVWTHVVWTLTYATTATNTSTWKLYINNTNSYTNTTAIYPDVITRTQNILGQSSFADPYYNGEIDDFRMYNRVLTPTEVTQIYNITKTFDKTNIGRENIDSANGYYFKGELDDFRIYNSVLTSQNITDIYTQSAYLPQLDTKNNKIGNSCVNFTGNNVLGQYVKINTLTLSNTGFSMAFWFRAKNNSSILTRLVSFGSGTNAVYVDLSGGTHLIATSTTTAQTYTLATYDNVWRHFVWTLGNASTASPSNLYINNTAVSTGTLTYPTASVAMTTNYMGGGAELPAIWFSRMNTDSAGTTLYNEGSLGGSGTLGVATLINTTNYITYSKSFSTTSSYGFILPSYPFSTNGFSFCCWLNITGDLAILSFNNLGSWSSNGLIVLRNSVYFNGTTTNNPSGSASDSSLNYTLSLNTWNHLVVNHSSNGACQIFVNKTLNATGTVVYPSGVFTNNNISAIMSQWRGSPMVIDDIRFYQRTLSAKEITDIYNIKSPYMNGAIDDFRLYNQVLTQSQVSYIYNTTPYSIYNGAYCAYEAKNYNSATLTWTDNSPNGRHLYSSSFTGTPTSTLTTANTYGSSVAFTAMSLTTTQGVILTSSNVPNYTLFNIARLITGVNNGRILATNSNVSGYSQIFGFNTNNWKIYSHQQGSWLYYGSANTGNWLLSTNYSNVCRGNGSNLTITGVWDSFLSPLGINTNTACTCQVVEVIIYNRVLSYAEVIHVETYLSEKYGLGLTPF